MNVIKSLCQRLKEVQSLTDKIFKNLDRQDRRNNDKLEQIFQAVLKAF
ncbi:hypothetical protein [Bartonella apis]|nr:hypothetical protein [Bartonella apis]